MNLQLLYSCSGSNSITLTAQSPRSVSMRPMGPGHTPWVSENKHFSGLMLSMKYLSSLERVIIVSGLMSIIKAEPLFGIGKTGNGEILYMEKVPFLESKPLHYTDTSIKRFTEKKILHFIKLGLLF